MFPLLEILRSTLTLVRLYEPTFPSPTVRELKSCLERTIEEIEAAQRTKQAAD